MNRQQFDFASLGIPSLESSDALAISDATEHPALSCKSSSEKSIDRMELSSEDEDSNKTQAVMDRLCDIFAKCESQDEKCPHDSESPRVLHQTQPTAAVTAANGSYQQPVGNGNNLPPPRWFYLRFWLGISSRLMKAESGASHEGKMEG